MKVTEFVNWLEGQGHQVVLGRHVDPDGSITIGDVDEVTDDKHAYLDDGRHGVYVERSGRVWLLQNGSDVRVYAELLDAKDTLTNAQEAAVTVMSTLRPAPQVEQAGVDPADAQAIAAAQAKPVKRASKRTAKRSTAKSK